MKGLDGKELIVSWTQTNKLQFSVGALILGALTPGCGFFDPFFTNQASDENPQREVRFKLPSHASGSLSLTSANGNVQYDHFILSYEVIQADGTKLAESLDVSVSSHAISVPNEDITLRFFYAGIEHPSKESKTEFCSKAFAQEKSPKFFRSEVVQEVRISLTADEPIDIVFPELSEVETRTVALQYPKSADGQPDLRVGFKDPITGELLNPSNRGCGAEPLSLLLANGTAATLTLPVFGEATDAPLQAAPTDSEVPTIAWPETDSTGQPLDWKSGLIAFVVDNSMQSVTPVDLETSDFDSDGVSDSAELAAGTDPWQANEPTTKQSTDPGSSPEETEPSAKESEVDTEAPQFSSQLAVRSVGASSVVLEWGLASDNMTDTSQLTYTIGRSSSEDKVDSVDEILALKDSDRFLEAPVSVGEYGFYGLTQETAYSFGLVVVDESGNASFGGVVSATTLDVQAPVAVLSGAPSGTMSATTSGTIAVSVTGDDVSHYRYKFGVSEDCSDSASYSSEVSAATSISISHADLPEGNLTLCVVARDSSLNWQSFASATTASWVVDNTAPVAIISGAPAGSSNIISLAVNISGSDVVSYISKIGDTVSDCSADSGYSASQLVSAPIATNISARAEGAVALCVRGIDSVGNVQAAASATSTSWTKDTTPPTASVTGQPSGTSNLTNFNITVSSSDVSSFRYKTTSVSSDCLAESGYSAELSNSGSTGVDISALADGTVYLCLVGKDVVGNWQSFSSATSESWTKDTAAPTALLAGQPTATNTTTTLGISVSGADVTHYRHKVGAGAADCTNSSGYSSETSTSTTITDDISGLADGSVWICVVGRDNFGNWQDFSAATSATWTKDTTAPPAPTLSLIPTNGLDELGVRIDYPTDVADIASVSLRRNTAGTIADCTAGALLAVWGSTFVDLDYTDTGAEYGTTYSYIVCVTDGVGLESSVKLEGVIAGNHRIFVTSETHTGDFTSTYDSQTFSHGLIGADYRCQKLANDAGLGGYWRAVVGDKESGAARRLHMTRPIYDIDLGTKVADDETDFWDGSFDAGFDKDETGAVVSDTKVWTGSGNFGSITTEYNCNNWSSASSTHNAWVGNSDDVSNAFSKFSTNCDQTRALMCVNQSAPHLESVTLEQHPTITGDMRLTIDFTTTGSALSNSFGKVMIQYSNSTGVSDACSLLGGDSRHSIGSTGGGDDQDFPADGGTIVYDKDLTPGTLAAFRVCVYDKNDNPLYSYSWDGLHSNLGHRLLFITPASYSGNLGGIDGADQTCATLASANSLPANSWKAVLSTTTEDAKDRLSIGASEVIKNVNDTTLATGEVDFFDGVLGGSKIVRLPDNTIVSGGADEAFTATTNAGIYAGTGDCSAWTSTSGSVRFGQPTWENYSSWINRNTTFCSNTNRHFYCMSVE